MERKNNCSGRSCASNQNDDYATVRTDGENEKRTIHDTENN